MECLTCFHDLDFLLFGLMSDNPAMAFGRCFRKARLKAGLSQQDIERISGLPQQYVSSVEHGQQNPTLETMTRLAEAVGQPLSELLRENN